jgi:3-methylcrotonyl-CoA carboxylase alpha subunit
MPTKGFQQYALHPRSVLAKVPSNVPLVQATTVPDNFVTAVYALFKSLGLPLPTSFPATSAPEKANTPILVYGAGATSGQYTIELLRLAGYKSVIAVASKKHEAYLKELGATSVVDYKSATFVEDIKSASGSGVSGIELVVDCVSLTESFTNISKVISPTGTLAWLAAFKQGLDGGAGLNGEGVKLFTELPEDAKAIFPTSVKLEGVYAFFYQKVSCLLTSFTTFLESCVLSPLM